MKKNIILPILFLIALAFDASAQWTGTTNIYNTAGGNVGIGNTAPLATLQVGDGANRIASGKMFTTSSTALNYATAYMGFNFYNSSAGNWTLNTDGGHNGGGGMFVDSEGNVSFVSVPHTANGTQTFNDAALAAKVPFMIKPWSVLSKMRFNVASGYQRTTINAINSGMTAAHNYGVSYIGFNAEDDGSGWYMNGDGSHNGGAAIIGTIFGDLRFYSAPTESGLGHLITNTQMAGNLALRINSASILSLKPVQIGSTAIPSGYSLSADGKVICEEVTVSLKANWPDYVFSKDHDLPSLRSVNNFIKENGHLPEMPTASEVEKNGIDLGSMNASLLKKIEELTLYVIELEKVNDEQSKVLKQVLERLDKEK